MSDSIPPLDPDLVGPLREIEVAPDDVRARAKARLLRATSILPPPIGGNGSTQERQTVRSFEGLSKGALASVAFIVGGVAGACAYAVFHHDPAPRVVYVDRVVPAPPVETGLVRAAPTPEPTPSQTSTPSSSPASPSSRASQLSAERVLLDQAREDIARGEPTQALERLERHRRLFAAPLLGEERDAMWIQALVKAGRYDEARTRADAFRRRNPDSLFSSMVESAIGAIP